MNKIFLRTMSFAFFLTACTPASPTKSPEAKPAASVNSPQAGLNSSGDKPMGTEVGNGDIITVESPSSPGGALSDLDFFKKSVEEIKGYAAERLSIVKTDKIEAALKDYADNSDARLSKSKFCVSLNNLKAKIRSFPENSPQQLDPEKRVRTNALIEEMLERCSKELELPLALRNGLSKAYNDLPVFSKLLLSEALTSSFSFLNTWDEKHYMALCRHVSTGLEKVPSEVLSGALTNAEAKAIEQSVSMFNTKDGYCSHSNFAVYVSEKAKEISGIGAGETSLESHQKNLDQALAKYLAEAADAEKSSGNGMSLCMSFLSYSSSFRLFPNEIPEDKRELGRSISADVQDAIGCRGSPG